MIETTHISKLFKENLHLLLALEKDKIYPNLIGHLEEHILELIINRSPDAIKLIKNPSDRLALLAVVGNPFAIKHIKNPLEGMCMVAIMANPRTIYNIHQPTLTIMKYAIEIADKHTSPSYLYAQVRNEPNKLRKLRIKLVKLRDSLKEN